MGNPMEVLFVVSILALWVLFPMGVFLSVGKLDKNTDQLDQTARARKPHTKVGMRAVAARGRIRVPQLGAGFNRLIKH